MRSPQSAHRAQLLDLVRSHGFAVQSVLPGPDGGGQDGYPGGFSYTVGLSGAPDSPELVLNGMGPAGPGVLSELAGRALAGERLGAGQVHSITRAGRTLPVALIDVLDRQSCPLWMAEDLFGGPGAVRALQVLWCDAAGLLPWENDYDLRCRQLLLGPVPDDVLAGVARSSRTRAGVN